MGALEKISDEKIYHQFEVNYFGTSNLTRALLFHLGQKRSGHILNVSSVAGSAFLHRTDFSTKYTIERFFEALAKELALLGVKLTMVESKASQINFARDAMSVPFTTQG